MFAGMVGTDEPGCGALVGDCDGLSGFLSLVRSGRAHRVSAAGAADERDSPVVMSELKPIAVGG